MNRAKKPITEIYLSDGGKTAGAGEKQTEKVNI